jgi:hypothetical protein
LGETPELRKIIKDNFELFKFQGRDMDTLAIYTKNIMSEKLYDDILEGKVVPNQINDLDVIRNAIEIFKQNTIGGVKKNENDLQKMVNMLRA